MRRSHGHQPFTEPLGGSFELLLQGIEGRFARVALVLRSDGRCSPVLRAIEVTAPRFSLRDAYLPAAYAEDDPASVLERFLANPEGEFTEIEGRIAAAQALLSPAAAPAEALPWLAGWMDLVLDPAFGDRRRRLFIRHAHRLLATRGTPQGLQLALRLALDPDVDDDALTDPRDRPHRRDPDRRGLRAAPRPRDRRRRPDRRAADRRRAASLAPVRRPRRAARALAGGDGRGALPRPAGRR